jgi:hypothetical protein
MRGLLSTIIRRGVDGDADGDILRPAREFDVRLEAERAAQTFLSTYGNLLSCFQLSGAYGLWETMQTYIQSKGLLPDALEAVSDGDEVGYRKAILRSQEHAFVDLCERRNALKRLQLVEPWPAEAFAEYSRMRESIGSNSSAGVTPSSSEPPAPAPVVLTLLEKVVLDFKGDRENGIPPMASDVFRKTWINDRRRRPVYDAAVEQGLL